MVKAKHPGYLRLQVILKLARKDNTAVDGTAISKHPREEDMKRRVLAVMAGVSCKVPLSVFDDVYFRNYTASLDPRHRPPHHLEINRIIEVLIDGAVTEFVRIVKERRDLLRNAFISLSTDFVTDPSRHQSFGVVLLDLVAEKYELNDGRVLFMSRDTARRIANELLSVSIALHASPSVNNIHLTHMFITV